MSSPSGTWCVYAAVTVVLQLCINIFLSAAVHTSPGVRLSNETDRMALLEFKSMIPGDPLGVLSSWNDSTHFCEWYGVSCSKKHGDRVTVLRLPSQRLSGSITPHIGNLSFLKRLSLFNNSLTKEIPAEIGRLRRLQRLSLMNNELGGEIPSNISKCSALNLINLAENQLVGPLPSRIGSLTKLQEFYVDFNYLSGTIPPSVGNLSSSLRIFFAGPNNFDGKVPEALGQLKNLQVLVLQSNNLSGEIPTSIFNISSIRHLSFLMNQLHGVLPENLGISLPNLEELHMGANQFTGSIPASLSNASNLVSLQLQHNKLTGTIPSMESSRKLKYFLVQRNYLGIGKADDLSFIISLSNATNLTMLNLHTNNFGGTLPEEIGNLPTNLEYLSLTGNKLSGSIPSGVRNLVNLQRFEAARNNFTGMIPSIFGNMLNLKWLDLSGNSLSGSIPSSIGSLTQLLILNLSDNNLEGEIPVAIESCKNLLALDLAYNNLSGIIPSQVMSLSSLSLYLNLSHNHFIGPIKVGSLINLGALDLSHNKLSGEIPSSLGGCLILESLNLQCNLLQGTLPSSLGSLRGIEELDASNNNFSGQIPKFLEGMKQLQRLNLSYNNFEGEVPLSGVFKNGNTISLVGNKKLCGGVVKLSLPPCKFEEKNKISSHELKIVLTTIFSMLLLAFIGSCLLIFWAKKSGKQKKVTGDDSQLQVSYQRLYRSTDGFSTTNLIGVGSFGSVYKGVLDVNEVATTIAVKVFDLDRRGASKSFMAECAALKNIRHRNLVGVLTVCSGADYQMNDFKALIYEFLANGSLEDWLHPIESRDEPLRILSFIQRLNVVIDVASAVDYLHHQCGTPIVHCDLKPSNVLLNEDLVAHVSDFGLARFLQPVVDPSSIGHISSSIGVKGTIGYAPPEYGMGNEVSVQGDVYSYGVLLLEIFTGRRPTDEIFKKGRNIHEFAKSALSKRLIANIVDPILLNELPIGQATHSNAIDSSNSMEANNNEGQILEEVLISIFKIGVLCSSDSPHERISISEVVVRLVALKKLLHDKFGQRQRGRK